MFETVVWATDGSENADRALPYACELARVSGAHLVAVHVSELLVGRAGGYPVRPDEDELVAKIERQVDEIRSDGVEITLRLATATIHGAAHIVAREAKEAGADVIVVGTRGHGPLVGALVGSVAQHLLHDASCPVLAIPPSAAVEAGAGREVAEVGR